MVEYININKSELNNTSIKSRFEEKTEYYKLQAKLILKIQSNLIENKKHIKIFF